VEKLRTIDRILMCWYAFSGLTHIVLEGYFVFTPDFFTFTKPHLLAEVCKLLISDALVKPTAALTNVVHLDAEIYLLLLSYHSITQTLPPIGFF